MTVSPFATGHGVYFSLLRVFFSLFGLVILSASAQPGEVVLSLNASRESALYQAGEQVSFVVNAKGYDEATPGRLALKCNLKGDQLQAQSWQQTLEKRENEILVSDWQGPGFVLLTVELMRDGVVVPNTKIKAAAGMEVEKIRPVTPEPDDFDGFWSEQLTRMRARVPRVTKIKTTVPENLQGKVKAEDFRLEDDVLTATGILVMPEDASVKKHAAVITFAGASWIGTRPNYRLAADADCLVLGMNLHDTINLPNEEETKALRKVVGGYQFKNVDDPEKYPMLQVFLRIVRCLDYLKTCPEWDGQNLIASGGSLGGAQALVAAALDPAVTLCIANAPALCDHLAADQQQTPGWPGIMSREQKNGASEQRLGAVRRTMPYFDMVNFARRVSCETHMSTGFIDEVCPPVGNYAVYNVLAAKLKSIYPATLAGHGATRKPGEMNVFSCGNERLRQVAGKKTK